MGAGLLRPKDDVGRALCCKGAHEEPTRRTGSKELTSVRLTPVLPRVRVAHGRPV
jgi:hypothetical protein